MNQEIIELLEEAKKEHNNDCLLCAKKDFCIDQALTLLEQQPPASEFTNDVKFVVTALKNCKKINPKNPFAVAEAIPDLLKGCEEARLLYDHLALSSLEAAARFGDNYEPPTDKDCLRVRGILEAAIAKAKKETKVIKKHGGCWPQAKKEG